MIELKSTQVILVCPHAASENLMGFYANVETYNRDTMLIEHRPHCDRVWQKCGHGKTPAEAIEDLEKVLKTGKSRRKVSTFIKPRKGA